MVDVTGVERLDGHVRRDYTVVAREGTVIRAVLAGILDCLIRLLPDLYEVQGVLVGVREKVDARVLLPRHLPEGPLRLEHIRSVPSAEDVTIGIMPPRALEPVCVGGVVSVRREGLRTGNGGGVPGANVLPPYAHDAVVLWWRDRQVDCLPPPGRRGEVDALSAKDVVVVSPGVVGLHAGAAAGANTLRRLRLIHWYCAVCSRRRKTQAQVGQ